MPNLTPFYLFSTITMNPLITKFIPLLTFFKWCLRIKGSSFSSTIWMSHMRSPKTTTRSGSIHSFQSVLQHVFFLLSSLLPLQHWIPVNSSAPLYSSFPILADCRSLFHWGKIHPLHNISWFAFYFNMYRANISEFPELIWGNILLPYVNYQVISVSAKEPRARKDHASN